jgi:hypothetical protein
VASCNLRPSLNKLIEVVGSAGLEPATSCL